MVCARPWGDRGDRTANTQRIHLKELEAKPKGDPWSLQAVGAGIRTPVFFCFGVKRKRPTRVLPNPPG